MGVDTKRIQVIGAFFTISISLQKKQKDGLDTASPGVMEWSREEELIRL